MADDGMVNVGQLVREGHADEGVILVGFGSYRGSVIAGEEWEAPMQRMTVPPARPSSWEDILHRVGTEDRLLLLKAEDMARAVGVSPATLMNKAKVIRDGLGLRRMDPRWSTRDMLGHNPLVWMLEIDGLPYDIRRAPRHIQEEAYRRGLIPFVPGEPARGARER
jgi:hypothetical protein